MVLRVRELTPTGVLAVVERPGDVGGGMGVNLPDGETTLPSLTEHDRACASAALAAGVDTLALSFVRRPDDLELLRAHMAILPGCGAVGRQARKGPGGSA